ncbi:MAG: formate/nitrite transporter family protein [Firmicutes bacterium]|nr:formate/nitrite transporter family protein [Bacillota bacterium]
MYTPAEVTKNVVGIGKAKAVLSPARMLILGMMAGMFIALGAAGSNTVSAVVENGSIAKLLCGLVFPTGLTMVLIAGSELFTGNCLMIVPLLEKEIRISEMLKNWILVYIGNFIGAIIIAFLIYGGGQLDLFSGMVAVNTIKVAAGKCSLTFLKAFCLGILCNLLVCIAVWISFAAKNVTGKIAGLYLPIMLFILCGFEHSVANMYYGTAGLIADMNEAYHAAAIDSVSNISNLTAGNFLLMNLLPVTLGNIVGGSLLVGCVYWFAYLKKSK